jgi:hypothetical protein
MIFMLSLLSVLDHIVRIREQGNIPGALDGGYQLALMLCTGSGNPPGNDLSLFRYGSFQVFVIFVVDLDLLVFTIFAYFFT